MKAFVKALKEPSAEITVSTEATVLVDSDPSIEDRTSTEMIDITEKPTPKPPAKEAKEKRNVWKVLVPLLVIIVAGAGGGGWWWITQKNSADPPPTTPQTTSEATPETTPAALNDTSVLAATDPAAAGT